MDSILLLFSISIVLIAYLLGAFLSYFFCTNENEDPFFQVFKNTLSGLLFIIIGFALIKTRGNTVMLLIPLLYIVWLITTKGFQKLLTKNRRQAFHFPYIQLIILIGFVFAANLMQSLLLLDEPFNAIPQGDYGFYASLLDYMHTFGVESTNAPLVYFDIETVKPTPYHYPELWLSTLGMQITSKLSTEVHIIASYSILAGIMAIGLIALLRKLTHNVFLMLIAPFFLFFSGILFVNILPQAKDFIFAFGFNPKTLMVSLFLLWSVYLLLDRKMEYLLILLFLPIINFSYTPAVCGTVFLIGLYRIINKNAKLFNTYTAWQFLFLACMPAVLLVIYYFIINKPIAENGFYSFESLLYGLSLEPMKPIKIISGTILILSSLYLLIFIPALIFRIKKYPLNTNFRKNLKQIEWLFIGFFIVSLSFWAITHVIADSIQFFYMPVLLMLNLLCIILIATINNAIQAKYRVVLNLFVLLYLATNLFLLPSTPFFKYTKASDIHSEAYMQAVYQELTQRKPLNKIGVNLYHPTELNGYWEIKPYNTPERFLRGIEDGYKTISLYTTAQNITFPNMLDSLRLQPMLDNHVFTQFSNNNYPNEKNIDLIQKAFVMDNNIDYMILTGKAELPNAFETICDTIIRDSKSGQSFVFFTY
jgi:hypothetical protein